MEYIEFIQGYEISKDGVVRNKKTKKVIKPYISRGYVRICIKSKSFSGYVHRILMNVFNPPNDKTMVVNHIDGVKSNNKLENLEWVSQKYNIYHSKNISKNGSVVSRQKILHIYETNKEVSTYEIVQLIIDACN